MYKIHKNYKCKAAYKENINEHLPSSFLVVSGSLLNLNFMKPQIKKSSWVKSGERGTYNSFLETNRCIDLKFALVNVRINSKSSMK